MYAIRSYYDNSTKRIYYSSIDFVDSVTIVANFNLDYTHVIGNYNMAVENEIDGKIFLENAFELKVGDNVPTIVSVEPGEVEQGKLLDFTVTGENTNFTHRITSYNVCYTKLLRVLYCKRWS